MNILNFLFPKRCLGCGRVGKYFCDNCVLTIKLINQNEAICPICEKLAVDGVMHPRCRGRYTLDGLTCFFRYDGVIQKAVKALKYRYVSDIAEEFTQLIPPTSYNFINQNKLTESVIIPIPLHPERQKFRGFNQAEILSIFLAKYLHLPVRSDLLVRVKKTIPQVDMKDRDARLKNVNNDVFSISKDIHLTKLNKPLIQDQLTRESETSISLVKRIFLVDDVFTTGATMRSAANVLKRLGAEFVWGITMAR